MAEMELFIKPIFAKESIDRFADDVERKVGGGGGAGGGPSPNSQEGKKQTGFLEQISRFTRITAGASTALLGISAVPGAFNAGKAIADTRENRMERAFRGGENFSEDIADRIQNGEALNEVLTQEMIIQEGLDQARRQAQASLEGDTTAAEDAAKTLDDLRSVYVDIGGTIDDFNDKVSTLAAKSWVDGEMQAEEIGKIDEAFDGTKEKIGDVAAGVDEFANNTETKMQDINNNIENSFGKALDDLGIRLDALPNVFNEAPLITKFKAVKDVLAEINDLLTDIDNFELGKLGRGIATLADPTGGFLSRTGQRILDSKKSGDSIQ